MLSTGIAPTEHIKKEKEDGWRTGRRGGKVLEEAAAVILGAQGDRGIMSVPSLGHGITLADCGVVMGPQDRVGIFLGPSCDHVEGAFVTWRTYCNNIGSSWSR